MAKCREFYSMRFLDFPMILSYIPYMSRTSFSNSMQLLSQKDRNKKKISNSLFNVLKIWTAEEVLYFKLKYL